MSDSLTDAILPIVAQCAPLRVKVELRTDEDRYYIEFDGNDTFTNLSDWDTYWGPFEEYVQHVLISNHFDASNIVVKGPYKAEAFVGTLFDFLTRERIK